MKKLFALLLCAVLASGVATGLVGCGDNTFNGNYKEVASEEQTEFLNGVANAEHYSITVENGVDAEVKVKGGLLLKNFFGTDISIDMDVSGNVKAKVVGEGENKDMVAEGAAKADITVITSKTQKPADDVQPQAAEPTDGNDAEGQSEPTKANVDVKAYYTEGFAYINGVINGEEKKGKKAVDIKEDLFDKVSSVTDGISLGSETVSGVAQGDLLGQLYAAINGKEGVKFLFDLSDKKVKVVLENFNANDKDGTVINGELYFIYDKDFNLAAIKADVKVKFDEEHELSVYISFKG